MTVNFVEKFRHEARQWSGLKRIKDLLFEAADVISARDQFIDDLKRQVAVAASKAEVQRQKLHDREQEIHELKSEVRAYQNEQTSKWGVIKWEVKSFASEKIEFDSEEQARNWCRLHLAQWMNDSDAVRFFRCDILGGWTLRAVVVDDLGQET
ncbi:MAG: hypothetical protein NXI32_05115, partial [bacterium]|nr:hypothetical protein [bacterium]